MKSHTQYLWMNTKDRYAIQNITREVEEADRKSGIKEGLCLVNAMHITSSVFTHDENSMQAGSQV
jgi:thiamine phosphate synthase YjbQ (UPF0047 family)